MRRIPFVLVAGFVFSWCVPLFGMDAPTVSAVDVTRVELAYRQGISNAGSREEQHDAAAVRADSLGSILETSYQATLAWLLDGNGRLGQVQREQADWQDERDRLLDEARTSALPASRTALDQACAMTLDRIEQLDRMAISAAGSE